ncbi:site-specific integrase [Pseudothauera nasutitermitis]|uniref:Site-specific integrase n=1 Tax=Pseudothauera nasutitermitis TaxID=2565930 RepID=A0A4S4AZM3_9RHOO|nr:site-specific integrase [Pseudothauera nasutitermitis]THF65611.1 site-specific integrase [Pseudothauera nasutitermitis]
MSHIRRRGQKWRIEVCIHGIRQSRSFDTEYEAIRWAQHQEDFAYEGGPVSTVRTDERTLAEIIQWFIDERVKQWRRTPTAQQREIARLNRLRRDKVATKPVTELDPMDFADFRSRRMKTAAPSTVSKELIAFRQVIDAATKELGCQLAVNPCHPDLIKRPVFQNVRDRVLSDDERTRLHAALRECRNLNVLPAVRLSEQTGLRLSELLGLTWRDVDFDARLLHVRRVFDQLTHQLIAGTKNGDQRVIPLTTEAAQALQSMPRADMRIFPVTHDVLQSGLKRALKQAGIADFRWHDLRHCAITMLAGFIPVPMDLMQVAGFRTLQQVLRYYKRRDAADLVRLLP